MHCVFMHMTAAKQVTVQFKQSLPLNTRTIRNYLPVGYLSNIIRHQCSTFPRTVSLSTPDNTTAQPQALFSGLFENSRHQHCLNAHKHQQSGNEVVTVNYKQTLLWVFGNQRFLVIRQNCPTVGTSMNVLQLKLVLFYQQTDHINVCSQQTLRSHALLVLCFNHIILGRLLSCICCSSTGAVKPSTCALTQVCGHNNKHTSRQVTSAPKLCTHALVPFQKHFCPRVGFEMTDAPLAQS